MNHKLKPLEQSWVKMVINRVKREKEGKDIITFEGFSEEFGMFNDRVQSNMKDYFVSLEDKDLNEVIEFIERYNKIHNKIKDKIFLVDHYQKNVKEFYNIKPFFYDKSKIFWLWNEELYCYEIVDEIDLMNMIDKELTLNGQTVTSGIKANYLEAFKRVGRNNLPKEAPIKWVQFKNKAFSIKSKNIYDVKPNYFFTNPIPWEIGETSETPVMDELIISWVGEEHLKTMYEIIGYCCYRSYPIQLLFSLCGSGRNGKSQFLKIVDKFIGKENVTTTEIDLLLNNRFETFKMYKKLVCNIGETNFGILENTSILKKLTGGDKIGYEMKNKNPFDDYNYAKPIIASNSLPSSKDTSDGYYRRWLIIDFPNEFKENGKDIIETIPEIEYNNLAKKITEILPELLERGNFTNQGTIQERKKKYIENSNPLKIWIEKNCVVGLNKYCSYNKAYTNYMNFLTKNKKRKVTMKEFKLALEDEGIYVERTSKKIENEFQNGLFVIGLDLVCEHYADYEQHLTQNTHVNLSSKVTHNIHNIHKNPIYPLKNTKKDQKKQSSTGNVGHEINFVESEWVLDDKITKKGKVPQETKVFQNWNNKIEKYFFDKKNQKINLIPFEELEKHFTFEQIEKAKQMAIIFEPKTGFFQLLQ